MTKRDIKNLIDRYIKANGNREITGPVLNEVITQVLDGLSQVKITPLLESGSPIANISVDGTGSVLYTPQGSSEVDVKAYYNEGTKILTITVNGVSTDIYAPDIDLSDYATKEFVSGSISDLKDYTDGEIARVEGEIPDITGFATKTEVTSSINQATASVKTYVDNADTDLQRQVNELKARGRYLTIWNCKTGLPETEPAAGTPYEYKTGDYFLVGTVGEINYKPTGNSYTGVASLDVEPGSVNVNDQYLYDGSKWNLLHSAETVITFDSIAGQPTDNPTLANALNAKQDVISDLEEIRQGANLGKTAAQPADVTSSINAVSQSVKNWVEEKAYSSVQFTQSIASGTKIGEINIDGIATEIYQSGDGTDNTLRSFLFNSQSVSLTALDCSVTNNYSSIISDVTLEIATYPSPGRSISVTVHNTDPENQHTVTIPSSLGNYLVYCNGGLGGSLVIPSDKVGDMVITEMNGSLYIRTSMEVSGGGGTSNYNDLTNKPSINGVELSGNKSLVDLGIDISGKEDTSNKVTTLDASSTDTQYPSAKCVYDLVGNVESLLQALR